MRDIEINLKRMWDFFDRLFKLFTFFLAFTVVLGIATKVRSTPVEYFAYAMGVVWIGAVLTSIFQMSNWIMDRNDQRGFTKTRLAVLSLLLLFACVVALPSVNSFATALVVGLTSR